jgi:hypothetical protein
MNKDIVWSDWRVGGRYLHGIQASPFLSASLFRISARGFSLV